MISEGFRKYHGGLERGFRRILKLSKWLQRGSRKVSERFQGFQGSSTLPRFSGDFLVFKTGAFRKVVDDWKFLAVAKGSKYVTWQFSGVSGNFRRPAGASETVQLVLVDLSGFQDVSGGFSGV